MAYVPVAFILAGMAAYTVLAGADFGAGLWTLLSFGRDGQRVRDEARHAMGPVWEANHVWLIFVLVVCWTAYPVAFGSITSTLAAPLLIAAIGIIFRGAAYALRGVADSSRAAENLLGISSVLTPFALGTAVGAIAVGRVPVGNAAGDPVTSWLNPSSVLVGALAVLFSGYLAAVYLAADSVRHGEPALAAAFRWRALVAGVLAGALALAGLLVIRGAGLNLTQGAALGLVCVSGVAGLATLALCWRSRFGLARLTAALAVAAVVVGWAAAQAPRFLPGMTVTQAAAGQSTLVALIVAVGCGLVLLVPSLALLYTLFLRGRLDTPESHAPGEAPVAPAGEAVVPGATAGAQGAPGSAEGATSSAGGATGSAGGATGSAGDATGSAGGATGSAGGATGSVGEATGSVGDAVGGAQGAPGSAEGATGSVGGSAGSVEGAAGGAHGAPAGARGAGGARGATRGWGPAAVAGLVAGAGLLVFTDAPWTHVLGVAGLLLCAVAVFALSTASPER